MNTLKQRLLNNWHLGRILRMIAGLMLAYVAIDRHDLMLGFFGAFFLFQALTDTSCCGAAGCYTPTRKQKDTQETSFEEMK